MVVCEDDDECLGVRFRSGVSGIESVDAVEGFASRFRKVEFIVTGVDSRLTMTLLSAGLLKAQQRRPFVTQVAFCCALDKGLLL